MLADMTPEEFEERWAHWFVEPFGREVEVASAVGATIINTIRQALSTEDLRDEHLLPLDFFMPKRESNEGVQRQDQISFASQMRARIGV